MEHTRKMALVPQQMLSNMAAMQQLQMNPAVAQMSRLDGEMKSILDDSNIPDDVKALRYNSVLTRYLNVKDIQMNTPLEVKVIDERASKGFDGIPKQNKLPMVENELLEGFSRNLMLPARLLVQHLKNSSLLRWTPDGKIIDNASGEPVPGSNIVDLIQDYVRNRQISNAPAGWKVFGKALMQGNVPREAIKNQKRWNAILALEQSPESHSAARNATPMSAGRLGTSGPYVTIPQHLNFNDVVDSDDDSTPSPKITPFAAHSSSVNTEWFGSFS